MFMGYKKKEFKEGDRVKWTPTKKLGRVSHVSLFDKKVGVNWDDGSYWEYDKYKQDLFLELVDEKSWMN